MDTGNESQLSELLGIESGTSSMLAQQYLLSQADYCRQKARRGTDQFIAAELNRLAGIFERSALAAPDPADVTADDQLVYRDATHAA